MRRFRIRLLFLPSLIILLYSGCSREPVFDGDRAYDDLVKICEFGPRVAGTEGHLKAGKYIFDSLRETTDICRYQQFTVYDSIAGKERQMFNIIASFYPKNKRRILLCAHWDSRPWSDQEVDSALINLPVLGANDGASGVGLLLEIARLLKKYQPPVGVDLVFFDGEDYGREDWRGGWFLGSKYFSNNLRGYSPRAAILVDMIGDADLLIHKEAISQTNAPALNDYIWQIAAEIGASAFDTAVSDTVSDDHVPLLMAGIKAIDIIDINYPYWHTQQDTPDKCSPESLREVGRVVVAAIFDNRITAF